MKQRSATNPVTPVITLLALLLATAFSLLLLAPAAPADDARTSLLQAADKKASGAYVRKRFLQLMKKPFDAGGKKKALLIGDSHGQDFFNAIEESGAMSRYQIRTRYIPGQCQIAFPDDAARHIAARDKALCKRSDNLNAMRGQIAQADVVMLAGNWRDWSAKLIARTVKRLNLKGNQKLVVVGRKSFGKVNVRSYLRMPANKLKTLRNRVDNPQIPVNNIMKRSLPGNVFVDTHALICGSGNTCPLFTNNGKLISFDGGHFTPDGAQYAGNILFRKSPALSSLR